MGRRVQIALALAAGDYATAANLIRNSPGLEWAAFVPAEHHDTLNQYLRG